MRQIVFDLETTGLDVEKDEIIEFAFVELFDLIPTGNLLHNYVRPNKIVTEEIEKITGLSNNFLQKQKPFFFFVEKIKNFIENSDLIAHNANFDISILNNELKRHESTTIENVKIIDTLSMARLKYSSRNTLDDLCRRFNVKNTRLSSNGKNVHTAITDANLLAKVYFFLVQDLQEQETIESSIHIVDTEFICTKRENPAFLSKSEQVEHEKFLEIFSFIHK